MTRRRGSLKDVLNDYKDYPGLVVSWVIFGPSGREERPETGGVLRYYTQCDPQPESFFKVVANTFYVDYAGRHPHNVMYKCAPALCAHARL